MNKVGKEVPTIKNDAKFADIFNTIQALIKSDLILAGHDVSSGGLITTLLEMCFADVSLGAQLDLSALHEQDSVKLLFNENCGIVFQAKDDSVEKLLNDQQIAFLRSEVPLKEIY